MFSTSSGWAQRLDDGALLHTTRGVRRWTVATPPLPSGQVIAALTYIDASSARVLSVDTSGRATAADQTDVVSWSTDNGGSSWIRLSTFGVDGVIPMGENGLDFVDPEHGWWSVGMTAPDGNSEMTGMDIYRTVDGGAQWNKVAWTDFATPGSGTIPSDCHGLVPAVFFNAAVFASSTTGWITGWCDGVSPYVAVTRNGGVTWVIQSLPTAIPHTDSPITQPPQFLSPAEGTMLVTAPSLGPDAVLYTTTNGGSTWSPRLTPETMPQAIDFINADNGWLLIAVSMNAGPAGEPDLWVTHNGGITWTSLLSAVANASTGYSPRQNLGGLSLDFLTTDIGWAAPLWPSDDIADFDLAQTTDGGRTWTAVSLNVAAP